MVSPNPSTQDSARISGSREFLAGLLSVLLPSSCPLCRQEQPESVWGGLCSHCWSELKPWTGPICHRCGLPLPGMVPEDSYRCADCRLGEPRFDLARSYGVYSGTLRTAVLQLKFHHRERLGIKLGSLLVGSWLAAQPEAQIQIPILIVPVPLHRGRERERGYNQAGLLAEGFMLALKRAERRRPPIKVAPRCMVRRRATDPQSGLSLHARTENVRGVFEVASIRRVKDHDIVLIDDVMTTGATASACAIALKQAGARRVVVLTIARATPQFPDV